LWRVATPSCRLTRHPSRSNSVAKSLRKSRKVQYLSEEVLIDAWGNPLQYRLDEDRVRVWSFGRDGVNETEDDITVEVSRLKHEEK